MAQTVAEKLGSRPALRRFSDARELIPSPANPTPLVRLNRVLAGLGMDVFLKLEWFSPFGSTKDRAAKYLLDGMAKRGELEGREIVEPTSGNTGIALAALGGIMGKKVTVTVPSGVPEEKQIILRMLGAEVWPTPDDLCPVEHPKDGAIALAHSFVRGESGRGRYAMPNQYENPDNVRAHYETTGPEIWRQTEGQVRHFFAGVGTCGTITGVGRFLKEKDARIRIIGIEPQKGHRLPGLKNLEESKEPGILERDLIDRIVRVDDGPAYEMTRRLFREEGLIVGPSTGAIVQGIAECSLHGEGVAVGISPDGGFKYASYFADVLGDEGKPQV